MPNLPASVGRGATGAFASPETSAPQRASADALLGAVGTVAWLGLGGAHRRRHGHVRIRAGLRLPARRVPRPRGEAAGLPADLASRLARATVEGAGELLRRSGSAAARAAPRRDLARRHDHRPLDVLMGADGLDS